MQAQTCQRFHPHMGKIKHDCKRGSTKLKFSTIKLNLRSQVDQFGMAQEQDPDDGHEELRGNPNMLVIAAIICSTTYMLDVIVVKVESHRLDGRDLVAKSC